MNYTTRILAAAALSSALVAQGPSTPRADHFRQIASYNVTGTVAEIVDAANQGNMLVYTDAGSQKLGFVDITNPTAPVEITTLSVPGEPTSVACVGNYAYAAVWADLPNAGSPPPQFLPGKLVVIDLANPANPTIVGTIDIGFHPDSCKAKRIGNDVYVVVAIENQPVVVNASGNVTSEDRPGSANDVSPAGLVQVIRVDHQNLANSTVTNVALPAATLTAAGCLYPNDPQPEFVAWNGDRVAVSLQENNGIAIIDMSNPATPALERVFSTGVVAPRNADLTDNATISLTETYPTGSPAVTDAGGNPVVTGSRMPDAIAFSPDGSMIYSADEGELNYTGGRGFSWFANTGAFAGDDGGFLEYAASLFSYYPDGRSDARGIEVEGIATGRFGPNDFAFVMSERGSFMSVWNINNPTQPRLQQILPTGLSPEGIVVIEDRGLVITADEVSGTLTVYQGGLGLYLPSPLQPAVYSADLQSPWAAVSGLTPGVLPGQFFGVPDNAVPTAIYSFVAGLPYSPLQVVTPVRKNGVQARYDGEGIAYDASIVRPQHAGFWIAHEGNATNNPNLLVQVDGNGDVIREIQMPNHIDAGATAAIGGNAVGPIGGGRIRSNGFEGCALSHDGRYVYAAIQREFSGEFTTGPKFARIARYDLQQIANNTAPSNGLRFGGDWEFFYIQFDTNDASNWPGLSEITNVGTNRFLVIERDKGVGAGSTLKKVYGFNLNGLTPDTDGVPDASDTVTKVLVRDCVADFSPYEKIEGIGVSYGTLWVMMDNDGGALESRIKYLGFLNTLGF
ncbi:MAG: hypothetical protein RL398_2079 [Planctomycetota bacterium]|jgi:hypothetical protein